MTFQATLSAAAQSGRANEYTAPPIQGRNEIDKLASIVSAGVKGTIAPEIAFKQVFDKLQASKDPAAGGLLDAINVGIRQRRSPANILENVGMLLNVEGAVADRGVQKANDVRAEAPTPRAGSLDY